MVDEEEDLDILAEDELIELEIKAEKAEELAQRIVTSKQTIDDGADEIEGAMPRGWGQSGGAPIGGAEGKLLGFKKAKQIGGGVQRGGDTRSRSPASRESWAEKQKEIEERIAELEKLQQEDIEIDESQEGRLEKNEEVDKKQEEKIKEMQEKLKDIQSKANQMKQKTSQMMQIFGKGGKGVPNMLTKGIQGKMLGMIGKLGGPWGMIIAFLIEFAITYITMMYNFIMDEIKGLFKPGGIYDVRKLVRDEAKQYQDLENLMKIRHGEVFFTSNTSEILRQGTPTGTTYIQQMGESMQQYIKTHDTDVE